jgi:hypothetical protein
MLLKLKLEKNKSEIIDFSLYEIEIIHVIDLLIHRKFTIKSGDTVYEMFTLGKISEKDLLESTVVIDNFISSDSKQLIHFDRRRFF